MSFLRKLGLYPKALMAQAYNPAAVNAAFARANNAVDSRFRDPDGTLRIADRFGFGGYSVPLPDELKAKAGTIYPQGMQLITQPLWNSALYTSATTVSLSFFSTTSSGITGNMDLAGALSFPKSFIVRAIRFMPQVSNSFQSTAAVVTCFNDISLLVFNSFHSLFVLAKQYLRIPSFMLPAGAGLGGAAVAGTFTAPASVAAANHGVADPRAVYVLLDPLWLETQVSFTYTVTWSAAQTLSANQTVFVILDGQQIQPVQ